MSLAPTLKLERTISAGVGLIATAGLIASMSVGYLAPATAAASCGGLVPTMSIVTGPVTEPDTAALELNQLAPDLLKIRIVTTGLPDGVPEENDLTPVLVWGDTNAPGVGFITTGGLVPALIRSGAQTIFVGAGAVTAVGLAQTVGVPAGQSGTSLALTGSVNQTSTVPTLLTERAIAADVGAATAMGLAPELAFRSGWLPTAAAQSAIWVDVPPP